MSLFRRFVPLFILFSVSLFLFCYLFFAQAFSVKAETTHVVISQVQVSGSLGAHQEFVELYNPTENSISLMDWELAKKTATGNTIFPLVATLSGTLKPHGYMLVAPVDYANATVSADITYTATGSNTITDNNTIILFSDAGFTRVDTVGMGTATDTEASSAANPTSNHSIIRKATINSTASGLSSGGGEEYAGNGFDDDNNANDFVVLNTAMPRNSSTPTLTPSLIPTSTNMPTETPLPTASPTEILVPTETPLPTPIPTSTPTAVPTPTVTPTHIPTQTPTPTEAPTTTPIPTNAPTVTPTLTIVPSPTIVQPLTPTLVISQSPTITPTRIVTPTRIARLFQFPGIRFACYWKQHIIHFGSFSLMIPQLVCELKKL